MQYEQLPTEYKYDVLAEAMYAREVEYFHYDFDRKNFEHLLANATDNEFAANVAERLDTTRKQMGNVMGVVEALRSQIDDANAYAAAVERVTAKRKAKEAEG
jgi:hydroxypyruvate isomerase